jgi:hypothetical protein
VRVVLKEQSCVLGGVAVRCLETRAAGTVCDSALGAQPGVLRALNLLKATTECVHRPAPVPHAISARVHRACTATNE